MRTGTRRRTRRRGIHGWVGLAGLLCLAGWAGVLCADTMSAGGVAPDTVARPRRASVRDSPGYYGTPDPESMSVVLGRRLNAPAVRKPSWALG